VVAAGGSASACLQPLPHGVSGLESALQHFQAPPFAASDIDLFYGLTDKYAAASKVAEIYQCVKSYSSGEVACVKTANTITIVTQELQRHIQIILHLCRSLAEILASFDIDCCAVAYDGFTMYASHQAFVAFVTQTNRVEMLHINTIMYEPRLFKYAMRGFDVYIPPDYTVNSETVSPLHCLDLTLVQ
jgi:hypothetical protein